MSYPLPPTYPIDVRADPGSGIVVTRKGLALVLSVDPDFVLPGGGGGGNGAPGKSAYELAVQQGFVGTLQQWLDSLKGGAGGSTDLADITFKQTDETGAVAMPALKKFRNWAFFGDRRSITGNGTSDDTTAAQNEIAYANANQQKLWIPPGMKIRTTAALQCSKWTQIEGQGGVLQKNNGNPNALGDWTGFFFDHTGVGLNAASADTNAWDVAHFSRFLIVRPQPTPVANQTWTPTSADFDISMAGCSGSVVGVEPFRSTNFLRIDRNYGHQVFIDQVKGQVFNVGIQVYTALDSVYLRQAHFWPFWTGGYGIPTAEPVLAYMLAGHIGLHTLRVDGISVGDLFCFAPRATWLIDGHANDANGIGGTLNNGTFHKVYNDNGANAITVTGAADGFVLRGNLLENYGSPRPYSFNGVDIGARGILNVSQYWSNNARNCHAAVQQAGGQLIIADYQPGGFNVGGSGAAGLYCVDNAKITVGMNRKGDATSSPYSPVPTGPQASGRVQMQLSQGLVTVSTEGSGFATWAHNAGQQPVYCELNIHDGGSGGAAIARRSGMTDTALFYQFFTATGAPVTNKSDIIVSFRTFYA